MINKVSEVKTFAVPFASAAIKENFSISTNNPSKERIIHQAIKYHLEGKILEASNQYQYLIDKGFNDHRVFSNYGGILKDLGKLQEAELLLRKAIEFKPDFAMAYSNLGVVLIDLGRPKEAEISLRKAIDIKPDFADAFANLGLALKDLGKLQEAELSLRQAIKLQPDLAGAHFNLGKIL